MSGRTQRKRQEVYSPTVLVVTKRTPHTCWRKISACKCSHVVTEQFHRGGIMDSSLVTSSGLQLGGGAAVWKVERDEGSSSHWFHFACCTVAEPFSSFVAYLDLCFRCHISLSSIIMFINASSSHFQLFSSSSHFVDLVVEGTFASTSGRPRFHAATVQAAAVSCGGINARPIRQYPARPSEMSNVASRSRLWGDSRVGPSPRFRGQRLVSPSVSD